MEFNPWLEKSLNFLFTWKNGILPGKVIENQWKSLKNFMCHVKLNLNMKTLMTIWLKVSLCHYIWDQICETMLADLHSRASCDIVANSWTTCYIVAVKPSQAAYAGKASMINDSRTISQIPQFISQIFYNHFLTSMCAYVYISVTRWCMEQVHGGICEMSVAELYTSRCYFQDVFFYHNV